jgi:hypothetical protein
MFWWRIENRKVTCAADPLALRAWDSGTPIRPQRALNPHHTTNFPQTTPLKTTTQESSLKAIISVN